MEFTFKPATKEKARLRLALIGPPGSGKTYTALRMAKALGKRIALADTERGSASKYAGLVQFDTLELTHHAPDTYGQVIEAAERAGYEVLIIDSLSHAWDGVGGALEQVDQEARRSGGKSFQAWASVTPRHRRMLEAITGSGMHIIATMRAKTQYVIEDNGRGKQAPRKVGMGAVQRDGVEYEFDVVGELDHEHSMTVTKSRCPEVADRFIEFPGEEFAQTLRAWLEDGADPGPGKALDKAREAVKAEATKVFGSWAGARELIEATIGRFPKSKAEAPTLEECQSLIEAFAEHGGNGHGSESEAVGAVRNRFANDLPPGHDDLLEGDA